ncbi:MAG: extracellular solute-binding protein [Gammaproteobacteria bacterium]|uniref:extracellular solute-binding protein n=1 Tax=Stutzerimonas xanthomarina TaxID=271420 RepID=UPI00190A81D1|nr:extracellular solute-binding protein [Stutzerimonas xanthomarina]MBU0812834.1 extracellular solute-binding protein [Gammaproteobacteria bacterium]MBK3845557.1 ABC transporter substrate-binding protein [Stutzerimonas xanthomarina]MBK3846006.1 ABC transporter substrate-binding protein [Stutzerimonas xanthomarina]MBK3846615.1 ABC transporter substrate-binding protein [Stutzerimonas xanthomarina]MBU0852428.1 extracellular solute-binding protein [Gammaproteobacteria bacterium]|tara:strand:- start:1312 stop:3189 length:1878 start_codon:yes stop_codon:yes gene_type:complete
MTSNTRRLFLHAGTFALLLLTGLAEAAPQHALTLYGEKPKYPPGFAHFEYVNPDAPKGGTLRQAGFGSFDSLNPFINKGVAADDIGLVYDTLTTNSLDEPFTVYGLLAEKIEKGPNNEWVRFYLRPEARFHDGEPVEAEDVVFSFETLISKGAPHYRGYYADVEKAVIESPRRIRFDFKHAGNRELPLILGQLPVLPKHWWEGKDFATGSMEAPLGSGPYRIERAEAGRSVRYARVEDYWGKDLAVNQGFYNFDHINIDYYRDNTVALQAFKAGHFDYWLETSAKNWATAYDIAAVKDGRIIKEDIANHNPQGMQGFIFNTRRDRLQDARVREALGLLFDFEWTNRQLFNGAYTRTTSYFDNSELASSGLPSKQELSILEPLRGQIPDQVFEKPFELPKTNADGIIRAQQRRAYELLTSAGWKIENDQMVDAEGKPVKLEFLLVQADFERVLLPYKRNLASLGIELELRRVDVSQYINRLRSRDYDMIVSGFGQSSSPGNEQREYWHSASADNPGSRNYIGLKDPAIDVLVEKLIASDSRDELITRTRALDRVLLSGHYVIPNWHIKTWRVAYWSHLGHPEITPLYDVGLMTWWNKPDVSKPEPEQIGEGAAAETETSATRATEQ